MGFYEIPVDFEQVFGIFLYSVLWNTEKIPKNYENITGISSKHMV